ncbi:restriction endonuclease subunit S [Terrabacter sp. 2RAF25]|uniref:restriction endonuclease subunit S n=1 Tax=Terrabacter sp. 2RAF25 TaxID=3232998 RepID=UPI003F9796C7
MWPIVALEDLAAPFKGSITDGPFGSNLARQHYRDFGPRVVRLQNIGDGNFIDNPAHIAWEHFDKLSKHEVVAGDLLIASLGDALPRACLAPSWLGPAIVKADCIRVRLRAEVDPRWVKYSMQRPAARKWADERLHGVGRMRLGLKGIREIPVPLPPLPEQRRIVDILEDHLSRLDAADAEFRRQMARIEALRVSAIRRATSADGVDAIPLGELLTRSIGGLWGSTSGTDEMDVRVIRVTELKRHGELNASTAATRSVTRKQFEGRALQPGDLLLEKSGGGPKTPVGRVGLVRMLEQPSICANFMQLMRPDRDRVDPRYLHLALNAFHQSGGTAPMQTASTNIRNIKASEYMRVRLQVPGLKEQQVALAEVEPLLDACSQIEGALSVARQRGQALRRALLAAAFEGKLSSRHMHQEVIPGTQE